MARFGLWGLGLLVSRFRACEEGMYNIIESCQSTRV